MGRVAPTLLAAAAFGGTAAERAGAEVVTLPVTPESRHADGLSDQRPLTFLRATVELPPGRHRRDGDAVTWQPEARTPCRPLVALAGVTGSDASLRGHRGRPAAIGLVGADGSSRTLPAVLHVATRREARSILVVATLPPDVLPAYPQRSVGIAVAALRYSIRCDHPPAHRLTRLVEGASFRVTGTFDLPPPAPARAVGLTPAHRLEIRGPRRGAHLGGGPFGIATLGDVTGDGRPELALGTAFGATHIVGVRSTRGTLDLRGHGHPVVRGLGSFGRVAAAGDVDGDGTGDVLVIRPRAAGGRGEVRILRGGRRPTAGRPLARLAGSRSCAHLGVAAAAVGDLDADGTDDLVVAADRGPCGAQQAMRLRLVRGAGRRTSLRDGVTLTGLPRWIDSAQAAPAGDVNGDGIDDLVIGAEGLERSAAAIVLGSRDPAPVDLRDPGARGIALRGTACEQLGSDVSAAGDVNGDGLGDVLVAAPLGCFDGPVGEGSVYVVLGGPPAALTTTAPGERLIRIAGVRVLGGTVAVAPAGDRDGDGLDDVAFIDRGLVRIVHGRREPGTIELRTLGAGGLRVRVPGSSHRVLDALEAVPDADGDGLPELAVAGRRLRFAGRPRAGAVLVISSRIG